MEQTLPHVMRVAFLGFKRPASGVPLRFPPKFESFICGLLGSIRKRDTRSFCGLPPVNSSVSCIPAFSILIIITVAFLDKEESKNVSTS